MTLKIVLFDLICYKILFAEEFHNFENCFIWLNFAEDQNSMTWKIDLFDFICHKILFAEELLDLENCFIWLSEWKYIQKVFKYNSMFILELRLQT